MPPPRHVHCSRKFHGVKNIASGQKAPILDAMAFPAFRSLSGEGMLGRSRPFHAYLRGLSYCFWAVFLTGQ